MAINYPIRYDGERRRDDYEKQKQYTRPRAYEKNKTYKTGNQKPIKPKKHIFDGLKSSFTGVAGFDVIFLGLVVLLVAIGLIMMYSASYPTAYFDGQSSSYFLTRQIFFAVIGFAILFLAMLFNYKKLHKFAFIILLTSLALMVLVLILPSEGGVNRWIGVGSFTFQPSEILKIAVILFLAHWASINFYRMEIFKVGVLPPLVLWIVSCGLLFLQPHYSGIVIITLLIFTMMFLTGVKLRYFLIGGIALMGVFFIAQSTGLLSYAMDRMDGWGQALVYIDENQWQDTYQTRNSMYAIGSGGLWGLGIGQSRQKFLYLPEPQNDFIFAIICEEIGFIGALIILVLFACLVARGIYIAINAKDKFGALLVGGITAQVGWQVILNILVITDWLPNTGISLPFFSYGGSSLIMMLAQMGIVLSVSKTANINKR